MNITDVKVRRIKTDGKMKAVVSITIDDCFVVHDIKVIEGNNGYFVAMPSKKIGDGNFKDIAHPINSETRALIQDIIFKEFENTSEPEPREEVAVESVDFETEDVGFGTEL